MGNSGRTSDFAVIILKEPGASFVADCGCIEYTRLLTVLLGELPSEGIPVD
jgi:hypothetical protein